MVLKIFLFIILFSVNTWALEPKTITAEQYYLKNPTTERKEILDFITKQFDGYKVTQAELDKLWQNDKIKKLQQLVRFQIVNQELYTDTVTLKQARSLELLQYYEQLLKKYKINDIDFIIYNKDYIMPENSMNDQVSQTPAFMLSKNTSSYLEKNKFLIPDAYMIRKRWGILINNINQAKDRFSWEKKINKIFWRGALTGWDQDNPYMTKSHNIQSISYLERVNLVLFSKLYPQFIDAQFVFYPLITPNKDGKNLERIFHMLDNNDDSGKNWVDPEMQLQYKYLISLDGNTCAWERVPWIMLSNSVLVKQETENIEWFYSSLKPYIHYIPVNKKLTNLFSQLEWMKSHDQELQNISSNAQKFVQDNLTPEDIDAQMAIILNEYSKIQQDKNIKITLKPVKEVLSFINLADVLLNMYIKRWFGE